MATYTKRGNSWRVEVCCQGVRASKTFPTKGECRGWAENLEHKIRHGKYKYSANHLLDDALKRYLKTVVPLHKGAKWERNRITALRREEWVIKRITDITPDDIAAYRDERLESVTGATVNRDLNLLSSVFSTAIREWGWLDTNPISKIRRPANSPPRHRRISDDEVETICAELTTESGKTVAIMFRLALQSAMRLGEMCGIREQHIMGDYVHLPDTKHVANRTSVRARNVPLTKAARVLVEKLIKRKPITSANASQIFAKAVKRAKVPNLTFHDSRHEACVMLAGKLPNPMDLAKITGHKDLRVLLNVYYEPSASELAAKLD